MVDTNAGATQMVETRTANATKGIKGVETMTGTHATIKIEVDAKVVLVRIDLVRFTNVQMGAACIRGETVTATQTAKIKTSKRAFAREFSAART